MSDRGREAAHDEAEEEGEDERNGCHKGVFSLNSQLPPKPELLRRITEMQSCEPGERTHN